MKALHLLCITALFLSCQHPEPMQQKNITVSLDAPDTAWSLSIEEVVLFENKIYVLANLNRQPGMAAQMITTVQDNIIVEAPPNAETQIYITGKTWNWQNEGEYHFIASRTEIADQLNAGKKLVIKKEPENAGSSLNQSSM